MKQKLTKLFLKEDNVAVRALVDIIKKAQDSGTLNPKEKEWSDQFITAIEKSGPDALKYLMLSFAKADEPQSKSSKKKDKDSNQSPKKGIDIDSGQTVSSKHKDKDLEKAQSVWDTFGNYPMKPQDDMQLGPAGVQKPADKPSEPKSPGMLSRLFGLGKGKKPKAQQGPSVSEPKPGKAIAKSTWDDYSNSGPKAPEPREKSGNRHTWDRYANHGPMGDRDAEDELGPAGGKRRKSK